MPDTWEDRHVRRRGVQVGAGLDAMDVAAFGVGLEPAFQPIVSLPDEQILGFEALARWPALDNPNPETVFDRAKATGQVDHLDRKCIDCAIEYALDNGLTRDTLLMLNCEPTSAYVDRSQDATLARAADELHVMFELTERGLLNHPSALLRKVAALREDGFAIALDDVGAHPDSLALLDVLRPEIIKLDLHLVQRQPNDDQARTLAAVLAHRERTGAVLLAEGIESDEHLDQALALGASMGQGFKFGRPGALSGEAALVWAPPSGGPVDLTGYRTPFDVIADRTAVRTARRETLIAFTHQIEVQALHSTDSPIVLTALQRAANFADATADLYREIAARSSLVAVFGDGLDRDPGCGIRGVDLDPADQLCAEWTVLMLGPHNAAALIAREQRYGAPLTDHDRRFDFAITYDRELVTMAARTLIARIP